MIYHLTGLVLKKTRTKDGTYQRHILNIVYKQLEYIRKGDFSNIDTYNKYKIVKNLYLTLVKLIKNKATLKDLYHCINVFSHNEAVAIDRHRNAGTLSSTP